MAPDQTEQRPGNVAGLAHQEQDISQRQLTDSQPAALAHERRLGLQTSIPEEDESNETGSEPLEPVTPTSDTHLHDLQHQNGTIDANANKQHQTSDMLFSRSPLPTSRTASHQPSAAATQRAAQLPPLVTENIPKNSGDAVTSPRSGLGRVGSFFNKLQRTKSGQSVEQTTSTPARPVVSTNVSAASLAPQSAAPAFGRRGSFVSNTARATPGSSASNSPPAPGSPSSTLNGERKPSMDARTKPGHRYSNSFTRSNGAEAPRPGIKFLSGKDQERPNRRRSASHDFVDRSVQAVDKAEDEEEGERPTFNLLATISRHATAGVGTKARRLSTSLPDEYNCDSCDLNKEFKSKSILPRSTGKKIGSGATATVSVMVRKGAALSGAEDHVAVKQFLSMKQMECGSEDEWIQRIKSEFTVANSLHHPNIIDTIRLCHHKDKWFHVMEYCPHGDLFGLVQRGLFRGVNEHYREPDRHCFFKQLIRAVDYLHSHGIAHRDVKLDNILMNKDGVLKLIDFGTAEVFSGGHPGLRSSGGQCGTNMSEEIRRCSPGVCGSAPYMAPEIYANDGDYDPRPADVWSCGIVFITMLFGGNLWNAPKVKTDEEMEKDKKAGLSDDNYTVFMRGWNSWLETHPDGVLVNEPGGSPNCGAPFKSIQPAGASRLIMRMLHPHPEKRITIRQICNENAWFRSIECCTAESYEETRCEINAGIKGGAKAAVKKNMTRKHFHVPPKEIGSLRKGLTHRFDMGEGWA